MNNVGQARLNWNLATPDERRIQVAEKAGWVLKEPIYLGFKVWHDPNGVMCDLPDFLNDLNAVAVIEKRMSDEQYETYGMLLADWADDNYHIELHNQVECSKMILSAPAALRCEAFVLSCQN